MVCSKHGMVTPTEIQTAEAVERGDLQRLVLERFPFPIAHGYRRMLNPDNGADAVDCAFYTYTATVRFAALVLLSQFLHGPIENEKAAKAVRQLQTPTLTSWHTALNTLSQRLFPAPASSGAYLPFNQGGPFSPDLVAAARRFSKLKGDGDTLSVPELLIKLRNKRAHATPWSEAECQQRFSEVRHLLDIVLELFRPIADVELLRRSPDGMVRLVGATEQFVQEEIDERLDELFEDSDALLVNSVGEFLPLYPLFIGGAEDHEPQGYTEPILVFDGHDRNAAVYLGARSRNERPEMLGRYLDLLLKKKIDPRFKKDELAPWNVAQWARESSLGTVDNLLGVKYFPAFYTERRILTAPPGAKRTEDRDEEPEETQGVDDVVARWLDRGRESALIVAAEAGAGKTSLFCRLTENLVVERQAGGLERAEALDCVLLLLGGAMLGKTTLFDQIRDGLGFSADTTQGGVARFDELLDAWLAVANKKDADSAERRLIILLDAANEAEEPKVLFAQIAELAAMAATANRRAASDKDRTGQFVRLVVSVRSERLETLFDRWQELHHSAFLQHPENFATFPDHRGRPTPWLALRRFSGAEAQETYEKAQTALAPKSCPAGWEGLPLPTRDLLRHPLLLRLFHEALAGSVNTAGIGSGNTVWRLWLDRIFDRAHGGAILEKYALDLADACINGGHNTIPAELVTAWHRQWQTEQGNDPIRIAAGMAPLEWLADAGILREAESGGLDWVSDSLAEQVFFRALHRQDPNYEESSRSRWDTLPQTPRLLGALVHIANLTVRVALNKVGDIGMRYQFDPKIVRKCYLMSLQICEDLLVLEPENTQYLHDTSVLFNKMGDMDKRGDTEKARNWYLKSLEISERLVALEPENTQYLKDLSDSCHRLAILAEPHDPLVSLNWWRKGAEAAGRIADLQPTAVYRQNLTRWLNQIARLEAVSDPEGALRSFAQILQIREELAQGNPDDPLAWYYISSSLLMMAEVYLQLGRREDEQQCSRRADEAMTRAANLKFEDAEIQYGLACNKARLGQREEALTALARSLDLGNTDADHAGQDPDLRCLWNTPEFEDILQRMRETASGQ